MKGVIAVVGGNVEGALLVREALEPHHYETVHCRAIAEFNSAIDERHALLAILLYPDEYGLVSELYKKNILNVVHGRLPIVFVSSSQEHNDYVRSLHYYADEFLI